MKILKTIFFTLLLLFNFNCHSQTNKITSKNSNIVDEFYGDLNKDGQKAKIVVYKNLKKNEEYEQNHFQLPIKIFSGNNKLWYQNDSLIYDNQNTCVSEGYSNVVIKNNFFTIESQSCYDYNILISVNMTFIVKKNKIFLYTYTEGYFDKSNHDKIIPSKMLTTKDFGNIEFDKVSIELIKKGKW